MNSLWAGANIVFDLVDELLAQWPGMHVASEVSHQLPGGNRSFLPVAKLKQLRREGQKSVLMSADDDDIDDEEDVEIERLLGPDGEINDDCPSLMASHSMKKETNAHDANDEKHQEYRKQVAIWRENGAWSFDCTE